MTVHAEYEHARPNAAPLMQSLRAFGYDICTAIADLIDNSITAGADKVSVQFEWNDGKPWIAISDNGYGMSEHELYEAMKMGSKNPLDLRDEHDLGRFGLGLKTASFSQCTRFTVVTKTKDSKVSLRCWDLDIVASENDWILLKEGSADVQSIYKPFFEINKSGTIVVWENLDKIIPDNYIENKEYQSAFLSYANDVKEHISCVFSSFMHGKNKIIFDINGNIIHGWDPFMSDHNFTSKYTEYLYVNGKEVVVKSYILPHSDKLSAEEFDENKGPKGWNGQQGFYIYRNNRLILYGGWLIPGMHNLEQYRLARIRIDIGNSTDSEWKIDVKKSVAVPHISIRGEIERIAKAARNESAKIFRHRGKKLARKVKDETTYVWHQNVRNNKLGYAINKEHPLIKKLLEGSNARDIKALLNLIEETVPVPMIISDYTERTDEMRQPYEGMGSESLKGLMEDTYERYLQRGKKPEDAIEQIASMEPFMYYPEDIELLKERKL